MGMRTVTEITIPIVNEGRIVPLRAGWICRDIAISEADVLVDGCIHLFADVVSERPFETFLFYVTVVDQPVMNEWVFVGSCVGKSGKRYFVWWGR